MATGFCLKFILIGDSGVGKTAILRRLVDDAFDPENAQSTIGVEFDSTIIHVDNAEVKLQIWDTAGQERFRSVARSYFRKAVGVVLVFDLTERRTFDSVSAWLNDVHNLCEPNAVCVLVGNKADLTGARNVTVAEGEQFAAHHQLNYLETSALTGQNVRECFVSVAARIHRSMNPKAEPETAPAKPLTPTRGDKKGGCC